MRAFFEVNVGGWCQNPHVQFDLVSMQVGATVAAVATWGVTTVGVDVDVQSRP